MDNVFTSVLTSFLLKTQSSDNSALKIAKKRIFNLKIAIKWIFEGEAQKILKNGDRIRVQHEKIGQNSGAPILDLYLSFCFKAPRLLSSLGLKGLKNQLTLLILIF